MKNILLIAVILCFILSCGGPESAGDFEAIQEGLVPAVVIGDSITTYSIYERMVHFHVPGAGIAVFQNGNIVWSNSYGVIDANSKVETNSEIKFQAASISKPVTALGVLKLVEMFGLDLDEDINQYLQSWKIENSFSSHEDVTIR